MTTIAIDTEGRVAWDSQMTCQGRRINTTFEKVIVADNRILAAAGDVGTIQAVREWFKKGARPKKKPDGPWDLLVIDNKGVVKLYAYDLMMPLTVHLPYAVGSGGADAMAAMLAGVNARKAVKIACINDIYSSPPVRVMYFDVLKEKVRTHKRKSKTPAQKKPVRGKR